MFYLYTGQPGAGKTLNSIYEMTNGKNKEFSGRPKYYNNVPLFFLDFEVCKSFAGWFYGCVLQGEYSDYLTDDNLKLIKKRLYEIRDSGRFPLVSDFPSLESLYDAWLDSGNDLKLWLKWVQVVYPSSETERLFDFLELNPEATSETLKQFNLDFRHFDDPRLWYELPRNSVIYIDECQRFFPPRKIGAPVPKYASEIETHRHMGITLVLVTQNAGLIDFHVRRLVNRHIHFNNPLAGKRVVRYQWDGIPKETVDNWAIKDAQKSVYERPKKLYGLYHSADFHNHKFKLPRKVILIMLLPLGLIGIIFTLTKTLFPHEKDAPESTSESAVIVSTSSSVPSSEIQLNDPFFGCPKVVYSGYTLKTKPLVRDYYFSCVTTLPDKDSEESKEVERSNTFTLEILRNYGYSMNMSERIVELRNNNTGAVYYFNKFY